MSNTRSLYTREELVCAHCGTREMTVLEEGSSILTVSRTGRIGGGHAHLLCPTCNEAEYGIPAWDYWWGSAPTIDEFDDGGY